MKTPKPATLAFEMTLTPAKPSGYHLRLATDRTPRHKAVECPCCKAALVLAPGGGELFGTVGLPLDLYNYLRVGESPRSLSATMAREDLQYTDTSLPSSDEGDQS